jgi:mannose-6-phosphate isomerase-like protein (cupin superfamily)
MQRGFVLRPGEGRQIDLGGFQMSLKASEQNTTGAFSLLEADEPPNFGPPMHIHHNCAEAFYVLAGEYVIFIEDQEFRCPAGSFVYIPPDTRHGFRVGTEPSRKLNVYVPGAMVDYFDKLSRAIADGNADSDVLDRIAAENGMEVIGPVPEGYL